MYIVTDFEWHIVGCCPYQFATAEAASVDAVREFLLERAEVDVVALVQCTSPFIQPRFLAEGRDSVQ